MMENQYTELGHESMQTTNFFPDDQWTYQAVASIDKQLTNSQVGNCSQQTTFGNDMPSLPLQDEQTSSQKGRVPKGKGVSRRKGGFTKGEDAIICSAFLNVSKDPIVGVNQSSRGYYKRMHEYYQAHKPEGSNRSQLAIQGRWGTMQKAVNKFCGIKSTIDRRQESGKNEQDRINDAVKVYEEKEPFVFMHCWRILRAEPKWNDRLLELNNPPPSVDAQANCSTTQGQTINDIGSPERPEGRDNAKKSRSKGKFEGSASSTVVDMLQQMSSNRESRLLKQDEHMSEILSRKDEKIKIQKEILETQKKELEVRQKEQEIRKMESEAQLLNSEAGIMSMDVDKLAPHVRTYYIGMQKQIMERCGFAPSSDS